MGSNALLEVDGCAALKFDLIAALTKVNWTNELCDARIPTLNSDPLSNSKFGNKKAGVRKICFAAVTLVGIVIALY